MKESETFFDFSEKIRKYIPNFIRIIPSISSYINDFWTRPIPFWLTIVGIWLTILKLLKNLFFPNFSLLNTVKIKMMKNRLVFFTRLFPFFVYTFYHSYKNDITILKHHCREKKEKIYIFQIFKAVVFLSALYYLNGCSLNGFRG